MATIASFKKLITILAAAACICGLNVQLFAADKPAQATDNEAASAVPHQGKGKIEGQVYV